MKYTNKWVVVPFSSFNSKFQQNSDVIKKIFSNKSLSKDEKIVAYNNYILKNKIKTTSPINQSHPLNDFSNTKIKDTPSLHKNNEEHDEFDEEISFKEEIDEEDFDQTEDSDSKSEEFNTSSEPVGDLNDVVMESPKINKPSKNIKEMSFYNEPPSKNTREKRNIGNETFESKILDNSINKLKKKSKRKMEQSMSTDQHGNYQIPRKVKKASRKNVEILKWDSLPN